MQKLNSKNYDSVSIRLRDEETEIIMNALNGLRLMDHLVSGDASNHVRLTDIDGNQLVVRTTDILRVTPRQKSVKLEDFA